MYLLRLAIRAWVIGAFSALLTREIAIGLSVHLGWLAWKKVSYAKREAVFLTRLFFRHRP